MCRPLLKGGHPMLAVLFVILTLSSVTAAAAAAGPPAQAAAPAPVKQWEDQMAQYGKQHCGADYYYDGARVYYQIAEYTKDPSWTKCAEQAVAAYRDQYLVPNKFAAAGWMIFPRGLWLHYQ